MTALFAIVKAPVLLIPDISPLAETICGDELVLPTIIFPSVIFPLYAGIAPTPPLNKIEPSATSAKVVYTVVELSKVSHLLHLRSCLRLNPH